MRPRSRWKGQGAFGLDAASYDRIRPGYDAALFELLRTECGLRQGARVLEIGPGTGQLTRGLLAAGASVMACEPDPRLAEFLRATVVEGLLKVVPTPFEEVPLASASYDLVVAATSFHWLNARTALARIGEALVPDGCFMSCWHIFNDPEMDDRFRDLTGPLLADYGRVQQDDAKGRLAFGLDQDLRTAELRGAGFRDIQFSLLRQELTFSAAEIAALYATFSPVATLSPAARAAFLDRLSQLVTEEFGGEVQRPLLTPVYRARAPLQSRHG
jgi:SAM-dependent methyltransferase